jgi:hypothetical protein
MIDPTESDAGLLAYEQVQAFASVRRRRLPLIYVLFPIVLVSAGVGAMRGGVENLGAICFLSAVMFAFIAIGNWRWLKARDVRNRALLADLQAKYGDDLPWLQVERQLAEIEKLKTEMANGNLPPEEPK